MGVREEILRVFPLSLREQLQRAVEDFAQLEEVRLRAGQPIYLRYAGREAMLMADGSLYSPSYGKEEKSILQKGHAYVLSKALLAEMLTYLCNYSVYAAEEQLRQGYLTIAGGHRVGICGEMLCDPNGRLRMHKVGSMNLRVAHERYGCADTVLEGFQLRSKPGSILVISPPGAGKTTLLRDMIRGLSESGYTVGVVDERSEIGACHEGVPQNALGPRTDVLDACTKAEGLRILLRTMAPHYLALDEVSGEDVDSVEEALGRGCYMLMTAHAGSKEELVRHEKWRRLLEIGHFKGIVTIAKRADGTRSLEMEASYVD